MDDKKFSFEKLEVYTESRKLVREVYQLVKQLPSEERFALGAQIRRAIVQLSFPPLNHKPSTLNHKPNLLFLLACARSDKKGDSRKKILFGTLGCPLTQRRGPPLAENTKHFQRGKCTKYSFNTRNYFAQKN